MLRLKRNIRLKKGLIQITLFLLLVIILLLVYRLIVDLRGYMPSAPGDQKNKNFDKYIVKYDQNYWQKKDKRKILIWTPFFGSWSWVTDLANEVKDCPSSCIVTSDKSELETSDAVVFHANDLWKYKGLLGTIYNVDTEMPKTRTPNQVWAVISYEPMVYMWGNIKPHTFNWTVLYRRESTIYNPFTPYRKKTPMEMKDADKSVEKRNYFQEKTKFATTLVSNCMDQAKRYKIIRELQRYIELDYFGYCSGNINCPAGIPTSDCGKRYMKDYKFYLAFENSFCRDYVSEKFWNALDRRQIPVIAAPKYNLEMLPPNSYLNVFDFSSIKALTDRMIEISKNETLYNSFFNWVPMYKVEKESTACKICKELFANRQAQSYDMEGWIKDDICYKSSVCMQITSIKCFIAIYQLM